MKRPFVVIRVPGTVSSIDLTMRFNQELARVVGEMKTAGESVDVDRLHLISVAPNETSFVAIFREAEARGGRGNPTDDDLLGSGRR